MLLSDKLSEGHNLPIQKVSKLLILHVSNAYCKLITSQIDVKLLYPILRHVVISDDLHIHKRIF